MVGIRPVLRPSSLKRANVFFIRDSSPTGTDTELEKLKMTKVPRPRYELNAALAYIRRLLRRSVCVVAIYIARFM